MGLWYNLLPVEMPVRRHPEDELFRAFCRKTLEERALDRPTRTKSCFCSSPSEERVCSDWPRISASALGRDSGGEGGGEGLVVCEGTVTTKIR